jgi:hypothetical protein
MSKRNISEAWGRKAGGTSASIGIADPHVATATKGCSTLIKKWARDINLEINVEEPVPATKSARGREYYPPMRRNNK